MSALEAVRTEISELEARLARLRQAEAVLADDVKTTDAEVLAEPVADAPAPQPPVDHPAPPAVRRQVERHYRAPVLEDALDPIRSALAVEPRSVSQLAAILGYRVNPTVRAVIRAALEQLDAVLVPATGAWTLAPPPAPEPPSPNGHHAPESEPDLDEISDAEVDAAYLERRILDVLRAEPLTPVVVAVRIDAPEHAVRMACDRLVKTGALSVMGDGSYVG